MWKRDATHTVHMPRVKYLAIKWLPFQQKLFWKFASGSGVSRHPIYRGYSTRFHWDSHIRPPYNAWHSPLCLPISCPSQLYCPIKIQTPKNIQKNLFHRGHRVNEHHYFIFMLCYIPFNSVQLCQCLHLYSLTFAKKTPPPLAVQSANPAPLACTFSCSRAWDTAAVVHTVFFFVLSVNIFCTCKFSEWVCFLLFSFSLLFIVTYAAASFAIKRKLYFNLCIFDENNWRASHRKRLISTCFAAVHFQTGKVILTVFSLKNRPFGKSTTVHHTWAIDLQLAL